MNKRAFLIGSSVVLLNAVGGMFAMHNTAFRAVQVLTSGGVIAQVMKKGYEQYDEHFKPVNNGISASPAVKKLVKDRLMYHGISQANEISVMVSSPESHGFWAVKDNALYVDSFIALKLETALAGTAEKRKLIAAHKKEIADRKASLSYKMFGIGRKNFQEWEDLIHKQEINLNDQDEFNEKFIAKQLGILNHETSHIKTGVNPRVGALIVMPIAVQGMCSSLSYGTNKFFKRKSPTSWKSVIARSGLAIGSVPLKLVLVGSGLSLYARYDEKNADLFACKNAKEKKELEGNRDVFKEDLPIEAFEKRQYDMMPSLSSYSKKNQRRILRFFYYPLDALHPYPGDRIDMFQEYIDNWDENHPKKDADNDN